jgi:hypothetical protein
MYLFFVRITAGMPGTQVSHLERDGEMRARKTDRSV